jgi:dihydrodipicolinate reductase
MINLVIHGYNGKLGKKVIENLHNHPNVKFIGYIDRLYDLQLLKLIKM